MKNLLDDLSVPLNRRSFTKKSLMAASVATLAPSLFASTTAPEDTDTKSDRLSAGDAALLRFAAAAEILESDFWVQYNELGGIQDSEVSGGSGIPIYTQKLQNLDSDFAQYIHDNTDDEITHFTFLNAYLVAHGAEPANLDKFRTLTGSMATGVNTNLIGKRLTNLTQLTLDTSWWTRYRSSNHNPDLDPNFVFPQAVPGLAAGPHTAIPRTDTDAGNADLIKAIAFTAGFHFAFIEQGGTSLYPSLAQRVTHPDVLRILLSIGPTETMHFQTWQDKAGNANTNPNGPPGNPPFTVHDPINNSRVTFFDLHFGQPQTLQANLIMPEPCPFLSRTFPNCSIIRPTETNGAAMGAVRGLTDDGLFRGQSKAFFDLLNRLAQAADAA